MSHPPILTTACLKGARACLSILRKKKSGEASQDGKRNTKFQILEE